MKFIAPILPHGPLLYRGLFDHRVCWFSLRRLENIVQCHVNLPHYQLAWPVTPGNGNTSVLGYYLLRLLCFLLPI